MGSSRISIRSLLREGPSYEDALPLASGQGRDLTVDEVRDPGGHHGGVHCGDIDRAEASQTGVVREASEFDDLPCGELDSGESSCRTTAVLARRFTSAEAAKVVLAQHDRSA